MTDRQGPEVSLDQVPERLRGHIDWAKRVKEAEIEEFPTDPDIGTHIEFWRGGSLLANVTMVRPNRDAMLQAIHIGVPGWGVDEVVTLFETYGATDAWFKIMKRKPDPGEFQQIFEAGNQGRLVQEQLCMDHHSRDGSIGQLILPYEYNRASRRFRWLDDRAYYLTPNEKLQLGGIVHESIERSFAAKIADPAEVGIHPEDFGISAEEAAFRCDVAVVEVLCHAGYMVHFGTSEEWQSRIMEETAERTPGMFARRPDNPDRVWAGPPGAAPTVMTFLGAVLREKLERQRKQVRAQESKIAVMNRAERRRTERAQRKSH